MTANSPSTLNTTSAPQPAPIWRRLAAMLYDSFLLFAVFVLATLVLLPFTQGEAIAASNKIYPIYLFSIWLGFYAGFWVKRGQTLGMLAWHLRIEDFAGKPIGFSQALLRLLIAIPSVLCGVGLLWGVLNRHKLTWHDYLSKSRIVWYQ
jgi:uncharacterized RDD family membrane protein YckC